MNRIKVVHHSKTIGYSGTDRTAQLFAKYLSHNDKFEPFIVYRQNDLVNTRLDIVKQWIGDDHVIPYHWVPGHQGQNSPFLPEESNLQEVLQKIDPQIVHVHRSGYNEWPLFRYMAPNAKWIETNIFGYNDTSNQTDLNIYISEFIKERALNNGNKDGPVLYNPIEQPVLDVTQENKALCRNEIIRRFKIPANAICIGRVGRPDNFDPISLRAFAEVIRTFPEAYYLIVNPCIRWREHVSKLKIENNVRFIDPIIDDVELSKFYFGLDIYAHARYDGECCPCNIQEAMMHGLPVVSHESPIYNGQSEIIGDGGFVVPLGDHAAYRDVLVALIDNQEFANEDDTGLVRLRTHYGRAARRRAMRYFDAECITGQLARLYDRTLENK